MSYVMCMYTYFEEWYMKYRFDIKLNKWSYFFRLSIVGLLHSPPKWLHIIYH